MVRGTRTCLNLQQCVDAKLCETHYSQKHSAGLSYKLNNLYKVSLSLKLSPSQVTRRIQMLCCSHTSSIKLQAAAVVASYLHPGLNLGRQTKAQQTIEVHLPCGEPQVHKRQGPRDETAEAPSIQNALYSRRYQPIHHKTKSNSC